MSFFFPKKFPRTSFLMIQMTEEQLSNHFYVYITCFGIQVEKCSRKVVEKCLYSQYEQETRIKGRGREHLLWDFEAKSRDKDPGCSRSKQNPTNDKPTRLSSSRGVWGSLILIIQSPAAWSKFLSCRSQLVTLWLGFASGVQAAGFIFYGSPL